MINIGQTNSVEIVKVTRNGWVLDGKELGEIPLPLDQTVGNLKVGDVVNVFVYIDGNNNITATMKPAKAQVGEFAFLQAVSVTNEGAFLDWGLDKDLFVPIKEQADEMRVGDFYVVRVYKEPYKNRIAASSKLNKFLDLDCEEFTNNDSVKLLIYEKTELGYKAIVNNSHSGLLYSNEVYTALHIGDSKSGFVKKVRDDGKLDLSLQKTGFEKPDELGSKIIQLLEDKGGFISISDKSPPELINKVFGVSKKRYKVAIGALFRKRIITITDAGIQLNRK